ncbi:protein of unknown function [Streptomyces sp. KY75]|nr:protein of unknown function [Streptomyces sp. KY75]CAD5991419.1 protein of unknown function [Streptomyces sp. KY70]
MEIHPRDATQEPWESVSLDRPPYPEAALPRSAALFRTSESRKMPMDVGRASPRAPPPRPTATHPAGLPISARTATSQCNSSAT